MAEWKAMFERHFIFSVTTLIYRINNAQHSVTGRFIPSPTPVPPSLPPRPNPTQLALMHQSHSTDRSLTVTRTPLEPALQ